MIVRISIFNISATVTNKVQISQYKFEFYYIANVIYSIHFNNFVRDFY